MSYVQSDADILRKEADAKYQRALEPSEQMVKQLKLALEMATFRLEAERRDAKQVYDARIKQINETYS